MNRGQYFTKNDELKSVVFSLMSNSGRKLEPSSGVGHLSQYFAGRGSPPDVSIELDGDLTFEYDDTTIMNFFDYPQNEMFDTIFGNPPYVKFKLIEDVEKIDSQYNTMNLYMYFIEKCFNHLNDDGEMIMIVPRDIFTSSRGSKLREMMFDHGTFTDVVDYNERKMFNDASPYIVIFRYVLGDTSHKTNYTIDNETTQRNEICQDGFIKFISSMGDTLDTLFDIRVGIVSGKNDVFRHEHLGTIDIICSNYIKTGKKQRYIFDECSNYNKDIVDYLQQHKDVLINRKIKKFNESNWMDWGAIRNLSYMSGVGKCIYVNCKTRSPNPFFIDDIGYFDGSILMLHPKDNTIDINQWCDTLNDIERLRSQGFVVGNKCEFTQKMLSKYMV